MTKKLKLFLLIVVVALTGGCAQSDDPKPDKEEREIAMRIIEVYANEFDPEEMGINAEEYLMYVTAQRIIKDYLDKAAAKID